MLHVAKRKFVIQIHQGRRNCSGQRPWPVHFLAFNESFLKLRHLITVDLHPALNSLITRK